MPDPTVLLTLWTEVGRHRGAAQSLPVFVRALADALPLVAVHIEERDAGGDGFTTLLHWAVGGELRLRPQTPRRSAEESAAIRDWARGTRTANGTPQADHDAPLTHFNEPSGAAVAGPLWFEDDLVGFAVVALAAGQALTAAIRQRFYAVLEPLAAALANDRRLGELRRLHAAAQADRDGLLSRLGRRGLTDGVIGAEHGLRRAMERVDRGRQGGHRARHSRTVDAPRGTLRARELRRGAARFDRLGAVRPREGQLHRCGRRAPGLVRARRRRHAVPG
jgi:hypothetical protein